MNFSAVHQLQYTSYFYFVHVLTNKLKTETEVDGKVELGEDMEKGFHLATRCFWKTVEEPQDGEMGDCPSLYKDGTLLTLTEDVIRQWKEHFVELLKPTDLPFTSEAEDGGDQHQFP